MSQYTDLITSEHRQPNFLTIVDRLTIPFDDIEKTVIDLNINTATKYMLDIIGAWVGQPRYIKIPSTFGGVIQLTNDEDYRQVLKLRIALNIWNGTTDRIYSVVTQVFGYNFVWIEDYKDMSHAVVMDVQSFIENQAMLMAAVYEKAKPMGVQLRRFSFANRGSEYIGGANTSTIYVTVYPL